MKKNNLLRLSNTPTSREEKRFLSRLTKWNETFMRNTFKFKHKVWKAVERVEYHRREMCDVVVKEIMWWKEEDENDEQETQMEMESSEECVCVKDVRWKRNKLIAIEVKPWIITRGMMWMWETGIVNEWVDGICDEGGMKESWKTNPKCCDRVEKMKEGMKNLKW